MRVNPGIYNKLIPHPNPGVLAMFWIWIDRIRILSDQWILIRIQEGKITHKNKYFS
jgi:hypothetical protein